MSFERFVTKGRGHKPQVSICSSGYCNLNPGTVRRWKLADAQRVSLHFDAERRMVGLSFGDDGDRAVQRRGPSIGIYMQAFCDYYNIDRRKRQVFEPSTEDLLLVFGPVKVLPEGVTPDADAP